MQRQNKDVVDSFPESMAFMIKLFTPLQTDFHKVQGEATIKTKAIAKYRVNH